MTDRLDQTRRNIMLGGAASVVGALPAPWMPKAVAQQKAEHTMVFAHTFSQATEKYVVSGINQFKELAEKYSGGKLFVDVHEGGKLGGQNVLPQKVQQGAVQATQLSMQNFTPYSEAFNVLDFPYLFPTNAGFEKFLESAYVAQSPLATESAGKGFKVLSGMWANAGLRVLGISKKTNREVRLPEDLKGLKVRVTTSKIEQQAFALTPGNPVSINWAEAYQAMQQGAVDGLNVGLGPLSAARIPETLGSVTKIGMSYNAHVTVVSKPWFDALPAALRDAIEKAAAESWQKQKTEQRAADERMWQEWKAAGIKVIELSPDESKQWTAALGHQRSEWNEWKERFGKPFYDRIVEIVGKA
jgi:TRAP-type C4-dicarboxylate transport system substrate-binding protein